MKRLITDPQLEFLKENYCNLGHKECARILGLTEKYMEQFCHLKSNRVKYNLYLKKEAKSEIMGRPKGQDDSKYAVHPDVFRNVVTAEAAYLLGLIWADGYVYDNDEKNAHKIVIENLYEDALIFKEIAEKTGKWKFYIRNRPNMNKMGRLLTFNLPLTKFLIEYGYTTKSIGSADKILSIIPEKLKHYFFRGLVDGDGSICKTRYYFSVYSSYFQDWQYMINICNKLNIKYYINQKGDNKGYSSTFVIGRKEDFFKFGAYIYQNYDKERIGLNRKYNIYKEKLDKLLNT